MRLLGYFLSLLPLLLVVSVSFSVAESLRRVKRIVGGQQSKAPPPDDPVVFTRVYNRYARVEGLRNERTGIYSFRGIYYAEPPVGRNRYARPIFKRMAGDINATNHGPPCIQQDQNNFNRIIGNEDCLLLNIHTPQMPDETTGLPVYVWIHPGGFRYGSAAQYDATPIAQNGAIMVVPQYRLGSLGIMGYGTKEFNGNLSQFDMASAIRWVREYIKHFGGDPNQIMIIGHGSGAASAMYLSMSRNARKASDITGVVAMSGTAMSQYATDKEPVQSVQEVAKINGCPFNNELEIVQCLRKKTAEEIIENDSKVQTERLAGRAMIQGLSPNVGFQPHLEHEDDGRALPSLFVGEPEKQLRSSDFKPVPMLTGVTKHETANAFTIDVINKVFGSPEKFLGSLTGVVTNITKILQIDPITDSLVQPVVPGVTNALKPALTEVWKVPKTLKLDQVLSKIVDSTTDVLFNLPAVLASKVWSEVAPAFMYSFEYNGTKSKGINFLRGLPIVGTQKNKNSEIVAHGDELGYMFDVNDIFGNPIEEARLTDPVDLKVRKNLIGMLVKFAGSFKDGAKGEIDGLFQSITGKATPFIKVDTKLEAASDFRFCELSSLGAPLQSLAGIDCESLSKLVPGAEVLSETLRNVPTISDNPLKIGGGTGGILGGQKQGGLFGFV